MTALTINTADQAEPIAEIRIGHCLRLLRELPDNSVHCCVTSPPYFGLRDYGVEGQIGLEDTPAEFIAQLVAVFREVRRVLREDGTCWVNMGDSYAGSRTPGFKPKDMMGIPWRLAFALQDDGWYLRQDIVWNKQNPMPESVTDRCTKAHEYIFLLSKSRRYYFDQEAILEPVSPNTHARLAQDVAAQIGSARANGGTKSNGNMKAVARKGTGVGWGHGTDAAERNRGRVKDNESMDSALAIMPTERNKRSVWTVPTHSFKGAHFATYPPDLIRPCILAGSPRGGLVLDPFGGAATTALVAMQEGHQRLLAAWRDGAAQMDILLDGGTAA